METVAPGSLHNRRDRLCLLEICHSTHRIEIHSELVMLGDLDNDNRWTADDLKLLDAFLDDPFADSSDVAWRLDLNRNGLIDKENLDIIRALCGT